MSDTHQPTPALKNIVEALLLAAGEPLSIARIVSLFEEGGEVPAPADIGKALEELAADLEGRGIELVEVASGWRLQTRPELAPYVQRLWEERPQRYSRALLETLALIAYRQPITRGEIEEVRGVSVSSSIIRTLQEREWIRVVGHRDVPGKPALFGTTRAFLDYFELKNLDDLPTLAEIRDMDSLEPEFDFEPPDTDSFDSEDSGDNEDSGNSEDSGDTDEAAATERSDVPGAEKGKAGEAETPEAADHEPDEREIDEASGDDPDGRGTAEPPEAESDGREEAKSAEKP